MSGLIIDINERLERRAINQNIVESENIAAVQSLSGALPPVCTKRAVRKLHRSSEAPVNGAMSGVFDYHVAMVGAFTASAGLDFRTQRVFEDSLSDLVPWSSDDWANPKHSYLDIRKVDPNKKDWIHTAVVTSSDMSKFAGEIVYGYRRVFPRRRVHPDNASEYVLRAAYSQASHELFAKALNAAALMANKFGTYRHGINMHNSYTEFDYGLHTVMVSERLRKHKAFELREKEAERFVRGFGQIGLVTELVRTGLVDPEQAAEIVDHVNQRYRNRIPKGSVLKNTDKWFIGYAFPYPARDVVATIAAFQSIEQPQLIDGDFAKEAADAFTPPNGNLRLTGR